MAVTGRASQNALSSEHDRRIPPTADSVSKGWLMGFEPTTLGTTIRCSNQLSYSHRVFAKNLSSRCLLVNGGRSGFLLARRLVCRYFPPLLQFLADSLFTNDRGATILVRLTSVGPALIELADPFRESR